MLVALLAILLLTNSCKQSDDAAYELAVNVSVGVTGTPTSGTTYYPEGEKISYSYAAAEGYTGLTVKLDNTKVDPAGTITMSDNHTLTVYAYKGTGQYQFSVSVATGVTGTPTAGYYFYNAGDKVNYNFSLSSGYTNLAVKLDNEDIPTSGTITVSKDHILSVSAEKEYPIQGNWTLKEAYADNSAFSVTATFSGEIRNGIVTDSDGGTGTYTVDGNDVNFTLVFPDVTYQYTGRFNTEDSMSGTAKRYTTATHYSLGSWSASRIKTTSARKFSVHGSVNGKKKGEI